MSRTIATFIFIFLSSFSVAFAQPGTIKGKVTDAKTGEGLPGVNVILKGKTIGASTDFDGNFTIANVPAGYYSVFASYISYKNYEQDVKLEAGKTITLNIKLEESNVELQGVDVVAERVRATESAVLMEAKKSDLVINAISAQQIQKSQDRDAAQVVRRIPGITIQDDRFVIVRGLSERYNTVMLNDVIAPSTEPDKKAFSFDLVPSNMIERMLVFKSGSSELPGEFGGAVIKIYTKNQVEENFNNISISTGVRLGTTFGDFQASSRSATDRLGFDDGSRSLPSQFPSNVNNLGFDLVAVAEATKLLENDWTVNQSMALPDLRLRYDMGRKLKLKGKSLTTLNSITYSNTRQSIEVDRWRFENYATDNTSQQQFNYRDFQNTNNVRVGIISNWAYQINPRNLIEFRNTFSQNGNMETTIRTGQENFQGFDVNNYSLYYQQRLVYNANLHGKHELGASTTLNWTAAYSRTNRNEPDWRRARTQRQIDTNEPFRVVIPPSSNTFDGARFFSELKENIFTQTSEIEHKIGPKPENAKLTLRAGYYAEYKQRDFDARWMAYRQSSTQFNAALLDLPLTTIFADENIGFPNGFILSEGTNFTDSYTAKNTLLAGYAGATWKPNSRFTVAGGIRNEFNRQQLDTRISPTQRVEVDNPINSVLPFINTTYALSEYQQFRFAYSRSINRPEFRELAPFSFYDFNLAIDIVGNSALQIATIDNIDLKYEFYPSPSEQFTVGLFYKNFTNPIETYIITGTSNPIFVFRNAQSAIAYGAEVELRKNFGLNNPGSFLSRLNGVLNAAYIRSEINLGDDPTLTQQAKRPLQGQSPYVVNAGIYYNDSDRGWSISALYNVYGQRIFTVGDNEIRTIYEMPRHLVDLSISKQINKQLTAKLGVSDLLNSALVFKEDGDFDEKLNGAVDKTVISNRFGQYITFDLSYRF